MSSSLASRPGGPALWMWLLAAFSTVAVLSVALTSSLVHSNTEAALDTFRRQRQLERVAGPLVAYYRRTGSWEGVMQALQEEVNWSEYRGRGTQHSSTTYNPPQNELLHKPWLLTDDAGRPVAGTYPGSPPPTWIEERIPLEVDGRLVGWFWMPEEYLPKNLGIAERVLQQQVQASALRSALWGLGLALALGAGLALAFTRPVQRLTRAFSRLAQGERGLQVHPPRWNRELHQLVTAFNQMSQALERAEFLRKQMTADLAHDLRTPISVLLGYSEGLKQGWISPSPEVFDTLHQEARYLQRLVEDLRLLSLYDAGHLNLNQQVVDLRTLVERVARSFQPQAQAKGVTLEYHVPPRPVQARVDPDQWLRVLHNLVSNALRHTPQGGRVTIRLQPQGEAILTEIEDTGEGIPPEHLPYIFERFYRASFARSEAQRSSGLGLAIVKALVEAHQGRIEVESQVGQGTRFRLWLPGGG